MSEKKPRVQIVYSSTSETIDLVFMRKPGSRVIVEIDPDILLDLYRATKEILKKQGKLG